MKTDETLLELIGHTPALRLSPFEKEGLRLYAELAVVVAIVGLTAARPQPRDGAADR
jgi:hypothetical protein